MLKEKKIEISTFHQYNSCCCTVHIFLTCHSFFQEMSFHLMHFPLFLKLFIFFIFIFQKLINFTDPVSSEPYVCTSHIYCVVHSHCLSLWPYDLNMLLYCHFFCILGVFISDAIILDPWFCFSVHISKIIYLHFFQVVKFFLWYTQLSLYYSKIFLWF